MEFLPTVAGPGSVSLRYLRVGWRQFWLRYVSEDDWRSNCGEGTVRLLCEDAPQPLETVPSVLHDHPLVAVDFLQIGSQFYAIDLSVAPGLVCTGVERRMTSSEVYAEIAAWFASVRAAA